MIIIWSYAYNLLAQNNTIRGELAKCHIALAHKPERQCLKSLNNHLPYLEYKVIISALHLILFYTDNNNNNTCTCTFVISMLLL